MKILFLIFFNLSVFAGNPILTPENKNNSGCNVLHHLGLKDKEDFLRFHDNLVMLVKKNDSIELSKLIHFPLSFSSKKRISIKNKKEFFKNYKKIFNEKTKKIILDQNRDQFFCKSTGLMYGDGKIWVNNFNNLNKLKIVVINQ